MPRSRRATPTAIRVSDHDSEGRYAACWTRSTPRTPIPVGCSSSKASTGRARRRSSGCSPSGWQRSGHRVFVTEWNSSALVKAATKAGKKKNALTPMTFSLLHATDFADRLLYKIIPPLKAGMIVLADRYAYTAFARDVARGVDRQWVRDLYSFAVRPDVALYFRVPIHVSLDRLLARRVKLKFYEAGMDMGWSANATESFRMFQSKVLDEYDQLVDEFGLNVVDAGGSITDQQQVLRQIVSDNLETRRHDTTPRTEDSRRQTAASRPGSYYGHGLPYVPLNDYPGKIIAIEGTDGVGRSTQIRCCANGSRCRATPCSRPAGRARS